MSVLSSSKVHGKVSLWDRLKALRGQQPRAYVEARETGSSVDEALAIAESKPVVEHNRRRTAKARRTKIVR